MALFEIARKSGPGPEQTGIIEATSATPPTGERPRDNCSSLKSHMCDCRDEYGPYPLTTGTGPHFIRFSGKIRIRTDFFTYRR